MKKWMIAFGVLLCTLMAHGQTSTGTFQPQMLTFNGTPTGVCDTYQEGLDVKTGIFYSCNPTNRTWVMGSQPKSYTVATLPAPSSLQVGTIVVVTDGASQGTCSAGGGTTPNLCYDTGSAYVPLSGGTGTFTGGTITGTATFNADAFFKSGAPWYDVQAFGAVCDGVTDDTAAITSAYTQLVADLNANGGNSGGGGAVHFPHASHPCLVHTLTLPTVNKGWIVTDFDNGLIADAISIVGGQNYAFIGHTGNFQGLSGQFVPGPNATIVQANGNTGPVLDLVGVDQVFIQGMNFECAPTNNTECVHAHDNSGIGTVYVHVDLSMVNNQGSGQAWVTDTSNPANTEGFGEYFSRSSFEVTLSAPYSSSFIDAGMINFDHPFWENRGILFKNAGISYDGQLNINDLYTENITNTCVLCLDSTAGNIEGVQINGAMIADPVGTVYLIKNTGVNTQAVAVYNPSGSTVVNWIDPTSTPNGMTLTCIGAGCDRLISTSGNALVTGFSVPANGRAVTAYQNATSSGAYNGYEVTGNTSGFPDLGLNATMGILFGDSTHYGFSAQIIQPSAEKLAIGLAQNMAPTGMSAAVSAGGSLANGTYYYTVRSALSGSTCSVSAQSAWSTEVSGTTTTGNNTIALSWTPAIGTVSGYCIYRGTTPNTLGIPSSNYFQSGGSSAGFVDTGTAAINLPITANVNGTFPATPQILFNLNGIVDNLLTPTTLPICPNGTGGAFTTSGCVSGGGPGTATTNGFAYWNTPTALSSNTPPAVQGTYNCGYTVPSTSTVVPTCPQLGMGGRALTGAATTDTVLFSDNATVIDHDKAASGTINETLPTATTLNNPNFVYSYTNHSAQTDTITPTTWTIQTGITAAGATISVSPGTYCRIKPDPNSATNWLADCSSVGSVTSITDTAGIYSNSSSTGAVSLTPATVAAHKYYGNNTSSPATGAIVQPAFGDLTGSATCAQMPALTGDTTSSAGTCATTTGKINGTAFAGTNGDGVIYGAANIPVDSGILASNWVRKDATNIGAAAMTLDMSASTAANALKIPSQAGLTSDGTKSIAYDTTNKNLHAPANNADAIELAIPSAPVTGDLADYVVAAGNVLAHDSAITTASVSTLLGAQILLARNYFVCAKANGSTCGSTDTVSLWHSNATVSTTISDANNCTAVATPCRTMAGVYAKMNPAEIMATVVVYFADAADSGTDCYSPQNMIWTGSTFGMQPMVKGARLDNFPATMLYLYGNPTTSSNSPVSQTCGSSTRGADYAVTFDGPMAVRVNGFQTRGYDRPTNTKGVGWGDWNASGGAQLYVENVSTLGDVAGPGLVNFLAMAEGNGSSVAAGQSQTVTGTKGWLGAGVGASAFTYDPSDNVTTPTTLSFTCATGLGCAPDVFAGENANVYMDRLYFTDNGGGTWINRQVTLGGHITYVEVYSGNGDCNGGGYTAGAGKCNNSVTAATINAANYLPAQADEYSYIDADYGNGNDTATTLNVVPNVSLKAMRGSHIRQYFGSALTIGGTAWSLLSGGCADLFTATFVDYSTCAIDVPANQNNVQLASDFTTANNTNFQTILSWTAPASLAQTVAFTCSGGYLQATAVVSDSFGIKADTNNPSSIDADGYMYTSATAPNYGHLAGLATTTATAIVTATPAAITNIQGIKLSGSIILPSSATTTPIHIDVSTTTGTDAITVKKGFGCTFNSY